MENLIQVRALTLTVWLIGMMSFSVMALIPSLGVLNTVISLENNVDKLLHLMAFFFLALWPALSLKKLRHIYWSAVLLAGMGVAIEGLQGLTPTRVPSVEDALANLAGIAFALLLASVLRKDLHGR